MLSAEILEDEPHKVFDQVDITVRCVAAHCMHPSYFAVAHLYGDSTLLPSSPHLTGPLHFPLDVHCGPWLRVPSLERRAGLGAADAARWWPKALVKW